VHCNPFDQSTYRLHCRNTNFRILEGRRKILDFAPIHLGQVGVQADGARPRCCQSIVEVLEQRLHLVQLFLQAKCPQTVGDRDVQALNPTRDNSAFSFKAAAFIAFIVAARIHHLSVRADELFDCIRLHEPGAQKFKDSTLKQRTPEGLTLIADWSAPGLVDTL
jgi:hypothetical protein